jgi:nitrilase
MGQEQGILYADVGLEPVAIALRRLDVVGHYERPGIFHFRIDRGPMRPVVFEGA